MTSSPDPRDLTPDQREFLDACEQVALLPTPLVEDDFEPLADDVLDLMEARGRHFRKADIKPTDLLVYERGLRRDGFDLAADGVRRMIDVYTAGVAFRSESN